MSTPDIDTRPQHPRRNWATALLCAGIFLGSQVAPNEAHAARKKSDTSTATSSLAKKRGATKVKHQRSASEESTAERDRRLHRECQGMPNAGACLGYTRR